MPDIFISYSRQDAKQAQLLTELLTSAGLSVWIDQSALNAASSWSKEIVEAINNCKVFVVLLSPASLDSHNVVKEVALASEKRKKILPLDLEPVVLTSDFEYQLAGIQRAPMTNIDSVIRALGKLGLEATGAPQAPKITHEDKDHRKSLMILPFEDLSPTQDNSWFTDGMASELINTLSNVKALKLIDWNTSKLLKNQAVRTVELAKDFSVRYFVEGQVRKFGDNIKISMTLLDIETGDHLWQDSMKGTMAEVFDIQEEVAKRVLAGLDVILTKREEENIGKKPTENAEAFELYLKGDQYFNRHTKSDLERALGLYEEAVRLDPNFAEAFSSIANTLQEIYRIYNRSPELLVRSDQAADRMLKIQGETARYFWVTSNNRRVRGDAEGALRLARRAVETDPKYAPGYDAIAFALQALGRKAEAAEALTKYVSMQEMSANTHFSLLIVLNELLIDEPASTERRKRLHAAAERAIPVFERRVRIAPDDYHARVQFANVLRYASRDSEALRAAEELEVIEVLDGNALFNLACLYVQLNDSERGLRALRRAVAKGYREIESFKRDPDLAPLWGTPEFEELMNESEGGNA